MEAKFIETETDWSSVETIKNLKRYVIIAFVLNSLFKIFP